MKRPGKKTSRGTSRSRASSAQHGKPATVEPALAAIAKAMKQLRARWYLFGAQAVALHGAQRATQDVDVTVLTDASPKAIVAALKKQKLRPRFEDADFIARTRVIPCSHLPSGWNVDVILGGPGLEEVIAAEAADTPLGSLRIPLLRLEHLLVLKILAGRPNDLADVDRLLRARGDVEHNKVKDLLAALESELSEPGLIERYEQLRLQPAK
jgi:hypothetical protein